MAEIKLVLQQKVEDMLQYGYPLLTKFPKAEKFSLAEDIRLCMNEMLRLTIAVDKKKSKLTALEKLDIENATLQAFIRLSKDLKFISVHSYGVWETKLVEIGKMIGGLLRTVTTKPKA